jgi:two-component system, chemotaxis family, CheB/CheR fusion protein
MSESEQQFGPEAGESAADPSPAASHTGKDKPLTVVGIGASAGGLAALQGFFDALPDDTGLAFVVVTHMDPERESLLPELLQKHTAMPVRQVRDLAAIEPNAVYVIPPGQRMRITDTHLDAEAFEEPRGRRMPIDYFFRSLAQVHRQAVAVILSGGGADGAVGVKAVKEHGGLLLVQEPAEAEHDSMPRAAIATGLADVVEPVAQLAARLVAYHRNGVHVAQEPEALNDDELEAVYRILTQVQIHTGHDFSQYKRSTLLRRIQRRMQLNGNRTLDAYLSQLRHEPAEAGALFNDLLIGVTSFFRDREAWEGLAEQVIPHLFEGKAPEDTVRVWSIGCATGEEAYSLAILLLEHAATLQRPPGARPGLQVFASDLDDNALHKARDGVYPEAIEADVSPERLARWFVKEGHYYRVRQELRDVVLFSNHSVLRDPPFSRLDLISCRNLLIYLSRDLQENVFRIFRYALQPQSYLFLGSAESAEMVHGLFHRLDKHHRLYRARPARGKHPHVPSLPLSVPRGGRSQHLPAVGERRRPAGTRGPNVTEGLHQVFLEEAAPPSVLVDEQHQILHISESAGRYLLHPRGAPTDDLLKLVRPELQFELRSALSQVFAQEQAALGRPVSVQFNGAPRRVILAVRPHSGEAAAPLALVFFLEGAPSVEVEEGLREAEEREGTDADGRDALVAQLEAENRQLRQRLQTTTEQYKSSHEELKAANEELQSINEEYRSTTEELETSKEELQSVNEELQTVNGELKNKLQEVSRAHGDLENLMVATDIATLFLDRKLRIQRYTASTAGLFNIMPGDRGRPIGDLTSRLTYDGLVEDASRVLKELAPIEREVRDCEGRWFLVQLRPYRTIDDRIDGVVLTFVDISEQKEAEAALRVEKEFSEKIVDTLREGLLVLNSDLTVEFANDPFYRLFAVSEQETVGSHIYTLGNGQWDIPELRTLLEEILPEHNVFNDFRIEHVIETIGRRIMLLNARRLDHVQLILLAIDDITEREQYEQALRESEARYRTLFESIDAGFCVIEVLFDDDEAVDYRFLETNPAFEEQTGLQDAVGKRIRALVPQHEAQWFDLYGRIARAGEPQRFTQQAKYLSDRWYDVYAYRVGQPEERSVAILFTDITERKQAEEALRDLTERLEDRVQERTEEVRELAGQLTRAEHEERSRIAQILHDDLQQQLYAMQIQLSLLRDQAAPVAKAEGMMQEIAVLKEALETASTTARQLSVELSPPILEGEGLAEALGWLSNLMEERYQLQVTIEAEGSFVVPDLDRRVLLFQAVRELLFNVVKYAGVPEATVRLQEIDDGELGAAYRIDVIDEGVGFDLETVLGPGANRKGRGLLHIRERLRFIGGRLEVRSTPDDGTRVTITAPPEQSRAGAEAGE